MGRRVTILLLVLTAIAAPAIALRAACVGNSCAGGEERTGPVAFCSLDPLVRRLVTAGFSEDRSPDAIAVTGATDVVNEVPGGFAVPWPSTQEADLRVPLVVAGSRVHPGAIEGAGLDQVAPTLEAILSVERPHPEVRTGRALDGVVREGRAAPLAIVIAWKGVGSADLEAAPGAWPFLRALGEGGAAGIASAGSVPLDPAAILATIGSGGLPSDHGITGSLLRTSEGDVARAWSEGAPPAVIAALGDDLDRLTGGGAKVGLVGTTVTDRGLIGGTWYGGSDDDTVIVDRGGAAGHVQDLLRAGWGAGGAPDLLGVALGGPIRAMDRETGAIVQAVQRAVPGAVIVVTATGSLATDPSAVPVQGLWRGNQAIAAAGSGGLFIDRDVATARGLSTQQVVDTMSELAARDGSPLFADAFPSFAVRFGRYC